MSPNVESYVKSCDQTCRKNLYCKLSNASQLAIIDCKETGMLDTEYGLEYLFSTIQNPWVKVNGTAPA